ncbi:sulfotransferase family 2 domain-containing protein [Synechococcus sp. BDU 130192]|uniref:sulfotransferase family 2 domain-containing protein n=1 Tax=Synechococcus sp. BDU 130192 TaxID=2042059 RepID=UPI000C0793CD|nr:sulfotransferase family 2 domain-containing protein [Synechococcus sp. BDU 130192]
MIISHKHKFIFIKTRKTAGTSLEIALSQFCGEEDIITPISPKDELLRKELGFRGPQNHSITYKSLSPKAWKKLLQKRRRFISFYNHISAKKIREQISDNSWNSYFKFCFERNPWDKVVSHYYWQCQSDDRPPLSEFIKDQASKGKFSDFELYSINNKIAVDKVYMYQDLNTAVQELTSLLYLDKPLLLPRAKSEFRTRKVHYSHLLNLDDKNMISQLFSREIETFGFEF